MTSNHIRRRWHIWWCLRMVTSTKCGNNFLRMGHIPCASTSRRWWKSFIMVDTTSTLARCCVTNISYFVNSLRRACTTKWPNQNRRRLLQICRQGHYYLLWISQHDAGLEERGELGQAINWNVCDYNKTTFFITVHVLHRLKSSLRILQRTPTSILLPNFMLRWGVWKCPRTVSLRPNK